jgi:hypothetical protein
MAERPARSHTERGAVAVVDHEDQAPAREARADRQRKVGGRGPVLARDPENRSGPDVQLAGDPGTIGRAIDGRRHHARPAEQRILGFNLEPGDVQMRGTQVQLDAGPAGQFGAPDDSDRVFDEDGGRCRELEPQPGEGDRLGAPVVDGDPDRIVCARFHRDSQARDPIGLTEHHRPRFQRVPVARGGPRLDPDGFEKPARRRNERDGLDQFARVGVRGEHRALRIQARLEIARILFAGMGSRDRFEQPRGFNALGRDQSGIV